MTNAELINYINDTYHLDIDKIIFNVDKNDHRKISVYYKYQKYPSEVSIDYNNIKYAQASPRFVVVDAVNKEAKLKMLQWMFNRFWIWLKRIDSLYDSLILGTDNDVPWDIEEFEWLLKNGYMIQKYNLMDQFDFSVNLNNIIDLYNKDIKDKLYKGLHIDCEIDNFLMKTKEELYKNTDLIRF
jgi:hypothetical protein